MLKFNLKYFVPTVLLFTTGCFIGHYMHDAIIRPFVGDGLIGIFFYCAIKSVVDSPVFPTAIFALLVCYIAETMQYFHFLNRMDWQNSRLARMVFGNTFSWGDMLCYTIGITATLLAESYINPIKTLIEPFP